jgi:hypothetical protein
MNVVFYLLGDSPASEFSVPTLRNTLFLFNRLFKLSIKMEQIECSETSAHKSHTPGNHRKERIQKFSNFVKNTKLFNEYSAVCKSKPVFIGSSFVVNKSKSFVNELSLTARSSISL